MLSWQCPEGLTSHRASLREPQPGKKGCRRERTRGQLALQTRSWKGTMPSSTFTTIDVRAPIEDAWSFLANLENAASWWPFVVGSAIHVRAQAGLFFGTRFWRRVASRGADACCAPLTRARLSSRDSSATFLAGCPTCPSEPGRAIACCCRRRWPRCCISASSSGGRQLMPSGAAAAQRATCACSFHFSARRTSRKLSPASSYAGNTNGAAGAG